MYKRLLVTPHSATSWYSVFSHPPFCWCGYCCCCCRCCRPSLLLLFASFSWITFFRNSWFPWETDLFDHVVVVLSLADKLSGKNGEAPDQSLTISVYFFSIERNSGEEERPLAEESPLTNFLLSNQQAKTVLYKRVKRQWSQFEEDRNEYYEPEYEAWEAERESEHYNKRKR